MINMCQKLNIFVLQITIQECHDSQVFLDTQDDGLALTRKWLYK